MGELGMRGEGKRGSRCTRIGKVVFIHFGVLPRARGCVFEVNEQHVYRAATLNYTIPFEHTGFSIEEELVDNVEVSLEERSMHQKIDFKTVFSWNASDIDEAVYERCANSRLRVCEIPFWRSDYAPYQVTRALRTMFIERKISEYITETKEEGTVYIVMSADILLNFPLDFRDLQDAKCERNSIFMTRNNDGPDGYTNGVYVGGGYAVSRALSTYDHLEDMFDMGYEENPYETLLKINCDLLGIQHQTLKGFGLFLHDLVKVRATGETFGNLACAAKILLNFDICPQLEGHWCFS